MARIIVTRTYEVKIAQDDLDRLVDQDSSVVADLVDACTRAADAGNLSGTMYLIKDDEALSYTDPAAHIGWVNDFDPEGQALEQIQYSVEEVDVVHYSNPIPTM